MKNLSRGFTLIEVLVVVLIIGILTSIALPQYRKAVAKARVMKILPLIRAIDSAEQVHYSTYMRYTDKFDDLDISMPGGGSLDETGTSISYSDFSCTTYENYSVYCGFSNTPTIEKYFAVDHFYCWHYGNEAKKKICASIPGSTPNNSQNDIFQ